MIQRNNVQPEKIIELTNEVLGKIGFVVLDRTVNGSAAGGIRFSPDVTIDEITRLARAMTLKWGFLNIPMGGGKAGIHANLQQLGCDRTTLMKAFGRSIASLVEKQIFFPGVDLGTTMEDLKIIMENAGRPLQGEQVDGSYCTALTVFETVKQLVVFLNYRLTELSFAIEGFGKVGSEVAKLLCGQGAKLMGISTQYGALYSEEGLDISKLLSLKSSFGDHLIDHYPLAEVIPIDQLLEKPVDLFVPGARPDTIHENNVSRVRAKMIVPIANIPFTLEIERKLTGRGIIIIPDFVANCGGILASGMHGHGFNLKDTQYLIETSYALVIKEIMRKAKNRHELIREIAEQAAWINHTSFNNTGPNPTGKVSRLMGLVKEKGLKGLGQRIAWRIYQKNPSISGPIRRAAISRYGEMGLEVTRNRIARLLFLQENKS